MDVVPIVAKEIVARFHRRVVAAASPAIRSHDGGANNNNNSDSASAAAGGKAAASAVTVELATLLTRLWLLGSDRTDELNNVAESAERIEELVETIVKFLVDCPTPNLSTLVLQSQGYTLKNTLHNKRRTVEVKKEAISIRLTDTIVEKFGVSPDELLGDITLYILHKFGQLSSTSESSLPAHKETAAVLCAVLPRQQVTAFTKQDSVEKQRQLEELRRIVWGIRIFNKEEGKTSGAGIEDVHRLVEEPQADIAEQSSKELERVQEKLKQTLAVLTSPTCALAPGDVARLREEYHHLLAVEHCLQTVRCMHASLCNRLTAYILPKYDSTVEELRDLFNKHNNANQEAASAAAAAAAASADFEEGNVPTKKEAVPKRIVYPRFVELSDAYEAAVTGAEEFEEIRSLMSLALNSEATYHSSLPACMAEEAVLAQAEPQEVCREELEQDLVNRLREAAPQLGDYRAYYTTTLPHTMDASAMELYPRSLCGFRGFCPVKYVEHGVLIPGNAHFEEDSTCPGYIVLEGGSGRWALHKPMTFAFASDNEARQFASSPLKYLLPCLQTCNREEPGVTLLLGLVDSLPRELYIEGARQVEEPAPSVDSDEEVAMHVGTQTGQIDSYLDHNYRWNEWDLRRQALKLANLLHMRTHSTQTIASHYRRENTTQARPPKEQWAQTMQDAAIQPPRVVQYIKGLRGTESSEIEQVQRTFLY